MAFLIDGFNLGHGYLGIEAMAAEVPIIFPEKIAKPKFTIIQKMDVL